MALGIPAVTRSHVLSALGAVSGLHALSNDDNVEMAQSIISLAHNHGQQAQIGINGAKLMREKYSLDKVGSTLETVYYNAVQKHQAKH